MKLRQLLAFGSLLFCFQACGKQELEDNSKRIDTIIPITYATVDTSFSDTVVVIITEDTVYIDTAANN